MTPKQYLASIGKKGGKARTAAKRVAARANGKLGGRPPKKPVKSKTPASAEKSKS
jgi:hypothetical protein